MDIIDNHYVWAKENSYSENNLVFSDYRGSSADTRLVMVRIWDGNWARVYSVKTDITPVDSYYQYNNIMFMVGYKNSGTSGKVVVFRVSAEQTLFNVCSTT